MGLSYVNGAQAGPVLLLVASELPLPRHSHVWAWEEDLQDEAGTHVDAQLLDAGSEQPLQCLRGREAQKKESPGHHLVHEIRQRQEEATRWTRTSVISHIVSAAQARR